MKGLIEAKSKILTATSREQLREVVEAVCNSGRYFYLEQMTYGDNAYRAGISNKPGVRECLLLAAKREKVL